ncbi:ankyrin repeat-containing domain protein [Lactarius hatsudake]|nr:ankyrin repeat-containing domain protein [Lactarius hatsudake]
MNSQLSYPYCTCMTRTDIAYHLYARLGKTECIHLLIHRGADPMYKATGAVTHSPSYWCLLLLLSQPEVSPGERDRKGRTALHWAARQRDKVSTRVLLRCGADPNAVDRDGRTPLHRAAVGGSGGCIGQLVAAGAQLRTRDGEQRTPRDGRIPQSGCVGRGACGDGAQQRRDEGPQTAQWVPSLSFCIVFAITSVFPWYSSIVLAPAALVAMHLHLFEPVLFWDHIRVWVVDRIWMSHPTSIWLLFGLCMAAFVLTKLCDPGTIDIPTEDELKPYHRPKISSLTIVDLQVVALDEVPPPRSSCVLPHEVCRPMSGDMFLSSVVAWSSLQLMWSGMVAIDYGDAAWRARRRRVKSFSETVVAFST